MQPSLKNEWKWILGFGFVSLLLIGLMTNFRFTDFEFQLHDSYFVVDSLNALKYLAALMYIVRSVYLLIDLITDRYRIFAFIIAFINPIAVLLMIILAYFVVQDIFARGDKYAGNFISQLIPAFLLISLIIIQIIVEVKALRKVWSFIKS